MYIYIYISICVRIYISIYIYFHMYRYVYINIYLSIYLRISLLLLSPRVLAKNQNLSKNYPFLYIYIFSIYITFFKVVFLFFLAFPRFYATPNASASLFRTDRRCRRWQGRHSVRAFSCPLLPPVRPQTNRFLLFFKGRMHPGLKLKPC